MTETERALGAVAPVSVGRTDGMVPPDATIGLGIPAATEMPGKGAILILRRWPTSQRR